jgi:hypothetical protein
VHFQRYLCARVEDRDTKRERFFAPESRERKRNLCGRIFEERRGEKKFKKIQKHTQEGVSSEQLLKIPPHLKDFFPLDDEAKKIVLFCYEQTIE